MDRRDALKVVGMGASGVMLGRAVLGQSAEVAAAGPRRKLRIALVGLGGYARFAADRLLASRRAELAGFVTGDPAKGREWAERLGIEAPAILGYDQLGHAGGDERFDAVHVCTPVGLHLEHAERALAAGKHVLCEKPLAATSAEARRLAALARERGRVLMPAYRAAYSNALDAAFARVRSGEWGKLVAIDAHKGFAMALPSDNWRFDPALAGGGALYDIGIYSVQLSRWAAGAMPLRVRALRFSDPAEPRFERFESHFAWLMEFPDGVVATGSASWRYHLQNHARLALERAWLRLEPATPAIGERLFLGASGPARVEELQLPLQDQVPLLYDDFAEAALEGRAPRVGADEGVADLVVMEALLRAAETGVAVEVPPIAP